MDEQHSKVVATAIVDTIKTQALTIEDLQWISTAAWSKIRLAGIEGSITMRPGDRVRASDSVNPAYVRGAEGTVIEVGHDKIKVRWDERFAYRNPRKMRGIWTMPGWSLEAVAETLVPEAE